MKVAKKAAVSETTEDSVKDSQKDSMKNPFSLLNPVSISVLCLLILGCSSAPKHEASRSTKRLKGVPWVITQDIVEHGDSEDAELAKSDSDVEEDATETAPTVPALSDQKEPEISEADFVGLTTESLQALKDIEKEILETDAGLETSTHHQIPTEINRNVRKWIAYFTVKDRERFGRFLERGLAYQKLVERILKENGVPQDLYFLGMIESGYVVHAKSRVRAAGAWQFMKGTGHFYGLKTSRELDERRDIVRSTQAAARYLKDLHRQFGSWYLALAAYNGGPGRMRSAIRRGGSHDFWELANRGVLPNETQNYVPKFLAAKMIGKNPERYGFKLPEVEVFPDVKALRVPGGTDLRKIAAHQDLPYPVIRALNPHLLWSQAPSHLSHYSVWVPSGRTIDRATLNQVLQNQSDPEVTALSRAAPTRAQTSAQMSPRTHRITKAKRALASHSHRTNRLVHRVRPGEHLTLLSEKYGVPISVLKRRNDLHSTKLYSGQRIVIR